MAKASSAISTKAKSFAAGLNAVMKAKRDKKIADLEKKGIKDAAKKVYDITFKVSKSSVTLSRTPEQQAASVASGRSWTCASAHMVDKARHVPMFYTAPGKKEKYSRTAKEPWGNKDEHFMTYSEFSAAWTKQLGAQDIRNYKGKKAFDPGDAWHVELPSGKLLSSDPAVKTCMIEYAKLTRIDGGKPNKDFENSKRWKSALAPHIKAAEAEKAKQIKEEEARKEKERVEELKKLRWDAAITGRQSLLSKVNRDKTPIGKSFGHLEFEGPIDCGAGKETKVTYQHVVQWDSLARDLFEFLGLAETKGFDVQLTCSVAYSLWTYDNLSQSFLMNLIPSCRLVFNTPAAKAMGMTVDAVADVKLKKGNLMPMGTVTFNYELKTPVNREKGKAVLNIKGGKVTSK